MATIYSDTADQTNTIAQIGGTCANIRGDATTASGSYNNTQTSAPFAIHATQSPRAGGTFFLFRTYFVFVLTGESGTVSSASFNFYGRNRLDSGDSAKVIVIQATTLAGSNDDYGNVFTSGTTFGTAMSAATEISGASATYHSITITGDASSGGIKEIQDEIGSGKLTIGLISWYYDYSNNAPTVGGGSQATEVWYSDYTGTSSDPYLDITYTTAAVADNATFFGANF